MNKCIPNIKVLQCLGLTGPTGPQGETGATGPAESDASSASCFCVDQMRNVIAQIIALYPNDNIVVAMESGNNVSGRPGALLPGLNES